MKYKEEEKKIFSFKYKGTKIVLTINTIICKKGNEYKLTIFLFISFYWEEYYIIVSRMISDLHSNYNWKGVFDVIYIPEIGILFVVAIYKQ